MTAKEAKPTIFSLLKNSAETLIANPVIFYPLVITAFVQLITLEILYFAPRQPLVVFFGPLIKHWGETFLHYPFYFMLLPKLFFYVQVVIYLFMGSFFNGLAVAVIYAINTEKKIRFKNILRESLPAYIHVFIAAILSYSIYTALTFLYKLVWNRALLIKSEAGIYGLLKKVIVVGEPFANLLIGVVVTTLFIFVFPLIMIDKKKIGAALIQNFKRVFRSFWLMLGVILIPTLFYIPILLLRSNVSMIADRLVPGISLLLIFLSVAVSVLIDAVVFTAVTTYYLFKKEKRI